MCLTIKKIIINLGESSLSPFLLPCFPEQRESISADRISAVCYSSDTSRFPGSFSSESKSFLASPEWCGHYEISLTGLDYATFCMHLQQSIMEQLLKKIHCSAAWLEIIYQALQQEYCKIFQDIKPSHWGVYKNKVEDWYMPLWQKILRSQIKLSV